MATPPAAEALVHAGSEPMLPWPYRVRRRHRETRDTWTLELDPEPGSPRLAFQPGQFNMLYAFGVGEVPISISGDPAGGPWVHTIRAVGAVSRALCALGRGETLGLRGPFGNPWPVQEAAGQDVVVVAGGIGLAPLRPAILHLLAHRGRYGRVVILYGARSPEELLFRRQLHEWRARFDLDVAVTVDHAEKAWYGQVGVVPRLVPRARFDSMYTTALVCGPEVMMRFTVDALLDRGVEPERIFLSMERNMKCGIGLCGHCQYGPEFVCRDGPVLPYSRVRRLFGVRGV